jgi:hypothetical protein
MTVIRELLRHKLDLCLNSSLKTVIREAALYKLLTFHNANLMFLIRRLGEAKEISTAAKLGIFKTSVKSLLLYGCET